MAILGFILVVLMLFVGFAMNKVHRDETGVGMPSRNAMRNMRRRARKNGISEEQAYNDWLKQRRKPTKAVETLSSRELSLSDDDLIVGWELLVTMQRRTPLAWLLRHREFHEGSDPPTEIVPMQHACWMPVTRSLRSLGIDMDEIPESTMASEVGQIPVSGGDFLPFLLEYRMIVEERAGTLTDLADRYPQYRDLLFPSSKLVPRRAPVLAISILDYAEIPGSPDQHHFNFEFHCSDCGGYLITTPDNENDPVHCTACGVAFDSLAEVKDACRAIAHEELKARKLGGYRET